MFDFSENDATHVGLAALAIAAVTTVTTLFCCRTKFNRERAQNLAQAHHKSKEGTNTNLSNLGEIAKEAATKKLKTN